jgi:hypothetical protein
LSGRYASEHDFSRAEETASKVSGFSPGVFCFQQFAITQRLENFLYCYRLPCPVRRQLPEPIGVAVAVTGRAASNGRTSSADHT